jgi:hypothetical protein
MILLKINGDKAAESFLSPVIKPPVYVEPNKYYGTTITDPMNNLDPVAVIYMGGSGEIVSIKPLSATSCKFNGERWEIQGKVFQGEISDSLKIIFSDVKNTGDISFTYEIDNQEMADFTFSLELEGECEFDDGATIKKINLISGASRTFNIVLNRENVYCKIKPVITSVVELSWEHLF